MPSLPKYTKCAMLGCKNTKSKFNQFCMDHGGRNTYNYSKYNTAEERKAKNDKYQTRQWKRLRQIQLSKQPLCQACLVNNIVTSAQHIDHVFPWSHIDDTAFYYNLFQSLCPEHHSEKTALEQRGIYRHYTNPPKDYFKEDYALIRATISGGLGITEET